MPELKFSSVVRGTHPASWSDDMDDDDVPIIDADEGVSAIDTAGEPKSDAREDEAEGEAVDIDTIGADMSTDLADDVSPDDRMGSGGGCLAASCCTTFLRA